MTGRKLADCGTPAAYRRHRRLKEPVDGPCQRAGAAAERDYKNRRETRAINDPDSGPAVDVTVIDGLVTFTFHDSDDARITAAAICDRAISLSNAPATQANAAANAFHAKRLHKRIVTQLREQGVLS